MFGANSFAKFNIWYLLTSMSRNLLYLDVQIWYRFRIVGKSIQILRYSGLSLLDPQYFPKFMNYSFFLLASILWNDGIGGIMVWNGNCNSAVVENSNFINEWNKEIIRSKYLKVMLINIRLNTIFVFVKRCFLISFTWELINYEITI